MKILFLLEDYSLFYTKGTERHLKLGDNDYQSILRKLLDEKFYQSNGMAQAFNRLGYDTRIIVPEAYNLQVLWAKKHSIFLYFKWFFNKISRRLKFDNNSDYRFAYLDDSFEILYHQVKDYKPEIVYFYSNILITRDQLDNLKSLGCKLVIQWTTPIWKHYNYPFQKFDLIISAAPQLVTYFSSIGLNSIYLQQCFDKDLLDKIAVNSNNYLGDVVFIGSFTLGHMSRFDYLEYLLASGVDVQIYGFGKENLPKDSLVSRAMKDPVFGVEMYKLYSKFKIALHFPTTGNEKDFIDWSTHAGAKRIFEITGSGTCLITPYQNNLADLFDLENDIVCFKDKFELKNQIEFLLLNESRRNQIASNGKIKTTKFHSFDNRVCELVTSVDFFKSNI